MKCLNDLKQFILSTIDDRWSNLEKIRYVYIEAGKVLCKYTEFFLTIENKMSYKPLSPKKIDKIYENKLTLEEWRKKICRSSIIFLKEIYDELGIESRIIRTTDKITYPGIKNDIRHYFLSVKDGEYNYFLTPASDYAYIQNNMETKHFATDISFLVTGRGGKKIKYYESNEEIPHKNLGSEELRKIDTKIGYITNYSKYNNEIRNIYVDEIIRENKNMYIDYLSENTELYNTLLKPDESKNTIKSIVDSSKEDWFMVIDKICSLSGKRLSELVNKTYCFDKQITSKEDLNNWIDYVSALYNPKDYNYKEIIYKNPDLLFQKTKSICNLIFNFFESEKHISSLKKDTISFRNSYIRMLKEIGKHFVDEKIVREPCEQYNYVTSYYLNARFSRMFPYLFGCNEDYINDFNRQSFSEQIEIIKYMVTLMFSDIDDRLLLSEESVYNKIKPIFRRINIYSFKEKKGNNYGCYFSINDASSPFGNASSYWYEYDISNNRFINTSLTNIIINCSKYGKYELLSNRLKGELSRLEEMGENNNRSNTLELK